MRMCLNHIDRWITNLFWLVLMSSAMGAAPEEKEYLFAYLQTTGLREMITDESTRSGYIVEFTEDSDPEAMKTLNDALAHYITGAEQEGQKVYLKGFLLGVKARVDDTDVYRFKLTGWCIEVPFAMYEEVGKEIGDGQEFAKYGTAIKRSLKDVGLKEYEWNGVKKTYDRYERPARKSSK